MEDKWKLTMYRPVGPEELKLLEENDFERWPPRLPEQPIFYPVTNEAYAREITKKWNVPRFGGGYVTRWRIYMDFADRYEIHIVGRDYHAEWWIPAEDLEELNDNIVGKIEVILKCWGP